MAASLIVLQLFIGRSGADTMNLVDTMHHDGMVHQALHQAPCITPYTMPFTMHHALGKTSK